MHIPPRTLQDLKEHYRIEETEGRLWFYCLQCTMGWSFPTIDLNPSNILNLYAHGNKRHSRNRS